MNRQTDSLRRFLGGGAPAAAAMRPHVLAVAGGKGGTGTSTVSALAALGAARQGRRALLVDTDTDVGSAHHFLGVPAVSPLAAVPYATSRVTPHQVLDGLDLLAGGPASAQDPRPLVDVELRTALRRAADRFDEYDLVVLDAGARLDGVLRAIGGGAGRLLVVTTGDPVAAAASYAVVKAVHLRHPELPIALLLNGEDGTAHRAGAEVVKAAAKWLGRPVPVIGTLPHDPDVRDAMRQGATLQDAVAGRPLGDAMDAVAPHLLLSDAAARRPAIRSA